MKMLMVLCLSSVLILGACGTNDTEQDSPPRDDTETDLADDQTETEDDQQDDSQDNGQVDQDDQSTNDEAGDQLAFVYNPDDVNQFDLHIELLSNEEWDYDFDRRDQEADIEYENGSDSERQGAEVFQEIEDLLAAIEINHERSINEMIDEVLRFLEINRDDLKEIDLDIETDAREKIGFNYHIAERNESATVDEFKLDIEFTDRSEWDYEYELNDREFSIEYSDRDNLSGQAAQDEMDRILSEVTIDLDQSIGDLNANFLNAIEVNFSELEEWDFEVEFEDKMKISAHYDRS